MAADGAGTEVGFIGGDGPVDTDRDGAAATGRAGLWVLVVGGVVVLEVSKGVICGEDGGESFAVGVGSVGVVDADESAVGGGDFGVGGGVVDAEHGVRLGDGIGGGRGHQVFPPVCRSTGSGRLVGVRWVSAV